MARTNFQPPELGKTVSSLNVADLTTLMTPNVTTGFVTGIVGRKSIPDLSKDLSTNFGVNRIITQQLISIQDEFGANGEPVFGVLNDTLNQIRFVGSGFTSYNDATGPRIENSSTTAGDYFEITFYGTGLNLLCVAFASGSTADYRVSLDGGTETQLQFTTSYSSVLGGRNYTANQISNVASGLAIGIHTVKIRKNHTYAYYFNCFGFEILNTSSAVLVNQGNTISNGRVLRNPSQQSFAYNSGFESGTLGSKGGRVLIYQKADGSIAKAVTPTDASALFLPSASHVNEEISRTYYPREFGAGRSDDMSSQTGAKSFTLDDGSVSLMGTNVSMGVSNGIDGFGFAGVSNSNILTFIGTGIDVQFSASSFSGTMTCQIDGGSATNLPLPANGVAVIKICSGLPYGTHVLRISFPSYTSGSLYMTKFIAYQPKTPALPTNAIELAAYNIMADFIPNTTAGQDNVATGVIRKFCTRENIYVGSGWIASLAATAYVGGWSINSNAASTTMSMTFFGTGFELRSQAVTSASAAITVSLNGTTATTANFATMSSSVYGGFSFNATTGVLSQAVSNTNFSGLRISGLPLGVYTVKFANASAAYMLVEAIDIVTPVHSPKPNLVADLQNTLTVGSQGIEDRRKLSNASEKNKFRGIAKGVASNPSTTSSLYVPLPDMSLVVPSKGAWFEALGSVRIAPVSGNGGKIALFVDGAQISIDYETYVSAGSTATMVSTCDQFYLSPGFHKIDLYYAYNGASPVTANGIQRVLTVKEL